MARKLALYLGAGILLFCTACSEADVSKPAGPVPVPQAAPRALSGRVMYTTAANATAQPLAGATVTVARTDGTAVSGLTATSNAQGVYQMNVPSTVTETELTVTSTMTGYGIGSTKVTLASDLTSAGDIVLAQRVVVTSASLSGTTGGSITTPSSEAATGAPQVGVVVPPNATNATTFQVTISSLPVSTVPTPPNPTTQNIYAAAEVGVLPAGTTFTNPFTITFPMPTVVSQGASLAVYKLNGTTWQTYSGTPTLAGDRLSVTLPTTELGVYAIVGPLVFSMPTAWEQESGDRGANPDTLREGAKENIFDNAISYTRGQTTGTNVPNAAWCNGIISQLLKLPLNNYQTRFWLNFPGLPVAYVSAQNMQINPDAPGVFGYWERQYTFGNQPQTRVVTLSSDAGATPTWSVITTVNYVNSTCLSSAWVWRTTGTTNPFTPSGSGSTGGNTSGSVTW